MAPNRNHRGIRWQSSLAISTTVGAVCAGSLWFLLGIPLGLAWLGGLSTVTFLAYGLDKLAAIKGWRRTPEAALMLLIVLGGAAGGWLGQVAFRHKTRKWSFWLVLTVGTLVQCVVLWMFRTSWMPS